MAERKWGKGGQVTFVGDCMSFGFAPSDMRAIGGFLTEEGWELTYVLT